MLAKSRQTLFDDYIDRIAYLIPEVGHFEGICGGRPVFTHSRLPLASVVASIQDTDEELLEGYPRLTQELLHCIRFVVGVHPWSPWVLPHSEE